jgi:hypothetical protein
MIIYEIHYSKDIHCPFCGSRSIFGQDGEEPIYCKHLQVFCFDSDYYHLDEEDGTVKGLIENFKKLDDEGKTDKTLYEHLKDVLDDDFLMIEQNYPQNSHFGFVIFSDND